MRNVNTENKVRKIPRVKLEKRKKNMFVCKPLTELKRQQAVGPKFWGLNDFGAAGWNHLNKLDGDHQGEADHHSTLNRKRV